MGKVGLASLAPAGICWVAGEGDTSRAQAQASGNGKTDCRSRRGGGEVGSGDHRKWCRRSRGAWLLLERVSSEEPGEGVAGRERRYGMLGVRAPRQCRCHSESLRRACGLSHAARGHVIQESQLGCGARPRHRRARWSSGQGRCFTWPGTKLWGKAFGPWPCREDTAWGHCVATGPGHVGRAQESLLH